MKSGPWEGGRVASQERESHGTYVPDSDEFVDARERWRSDLGQDHELRQRALDLQVDAERHRFSYTWEWAGVPLVRLPDDVMLLQELVWSYKPQRIVETGVARGGSLLMDAGLMAMTGHSPAVLGIDSQVFDHTWTALEAHPLAVGVEVVEADSAGEVARERVENFLSGVDRALLVLDSNHTHDHVIAELRSLATLLPVGGLVLVADTLIDELPPGHFVDRPWDVGNSPLTALRAFLEEDDRFEGADEWGRRSLVTEFRDGVVRRTR